MRMRSKAALVFLLVLTCQLRWTSSSLLDLSRSIKIYAEEGHNRISREEEPLPPPNCTWIANKHDQVECDGRQYDVTSDDETQQYLSGHRWTEILISVLLVLMAGVMSGLTMGLMSMDPMNLKILVRSAPEPRDRIYAQRILPLVKRHHLLLVTLLLGNASCMEALPLFLDRLVGPLAAILVSTTAVLAFGEIIPQALCTRYGLAIGGHTYWFVWGLIALLSPIAWPISKLLDCVLGTEEQTLYRRAELKELVGYHGVGADFDDEDGSGSSESSSHSDDPDAYPERHYSSSPHSRPPSPLNGSGGGGGSSGSAYSSSGPSSSMGSTPPGGAYSSTTSALLVSDDPTASERRLSSWLSNASDRKSSRERKVDRKDDKLSKDEVRIIKGAIDLRDKNVFRAMTPMQKCFTLPYNTRMDLETMTKIFESGHSRIPIWREDEEDIIGMILAKQLIMLSPSDSTPLSSLHIHRTPMIPSTMSLSQLLNIFQRGRSHLAIVVDPRDHITPIGIITLEDVIEELIQGEILDETDRSKRESDRSSRSRSLSYLSQSTYASTSTPLLSIPTSYAIPPPVDPPSSLI